MAFVDESVRLVGTLRPSQARELFNAVASLNSGEVNLKLRGGKLVAMTVHRRIPAA